jgi:glyoxylase-like metal-dependent hydrolase (beta-lactamase superfamily II)
VERTPTDVIELVPASVLGEGIVQLRLPMRGNPLRYVNGYLLEEPDGLTLVDTGWKADDVLAALETGLATVGFALGDLRRVLCTHLHFDHYGLAGTLRRSGAAEVMMHRLDYERAEEVILRRPLIDREENAWLARHGFTVSDEDDDDGWASRAELTLPTRFLDDGDRVGRLVAVWTPGHSAGHLCFHDTRSGRMLTGDHVLDPITPHVAKWRDNAADPLGSYITSLGKMQRADATGALPGHGEPFADLAGRAKAILDHTLAREDSVIAIARARGAVNATEVARALPWTRRNRSFAELGTWHQFFAMTETIAHLEHLRLTDRMVRDETDDALTYRLSG